MARMIDGQWEGAWRPTDEDGNGKFLRKPSVFRDQLPAGPIEPGRYHLFVAWTCPWAHRTLLARSLKGHERLFDVHFANELTEQSWRFADPGQSPYGDEFIYQLYLRADPHYTGRITVPVLWDSVEQRIVNNESSDILRMLDELPSDRPSLRPAELVDEIDALGDAMYSSLNNGVYRAGFATEQSAYDDAVRDVFGTLDRLEQRLSRRKWLVGDQLTEADLRLFVTTFRFDGAYVPFFRCNLRRLADYPNLSAHLLRVYGTPGVAETCNYEGMRRGYASIQAVNPSGLLPVGPPNMLESGSRLAAAS